MSSSLFEEAIADAKKIREVAEENAKKAVLEAVTPKIREFIESQILEQDDDKDKDDKKNEMGCTKTSEGSCSASEDVKEGKASGRNCTNCGGMIYEKADSLVELDESAISALMDLIGEDSQSLTYRSRDVASRAISEAVSRLTASEKQKLFSMAQKIGGQAESLNSRDLYNLKENNNMSTEKYYEIDLKTLREALDGENEMADPMSELLYEEDEDMEMPEEDDELLADDMADDVGAEGEMISRDEVERQIEELISDLGLEIGEGAEEEPLDLGGEDMELPELPGDEEMEEPAEMNEVFDIDPKMLQQELRRIRSLSEASERGLAHESGGIAKDYEHHFGGKGSANSKGGDFGGGKPGKDVLAEMRYALRNQRRQNTSLQNKLTKYRGAVNTLREQLEELNLFNAKLLYVNKLLQNKQISESQKRSIVQALDEAKDLKEAKVLYKSLTESFSQSKSSSKGSLTESVRYGGSSRTTRSASSQQATGEVNRWARLAGLK